MLKSFLKLKLTSGASQQGYAGISGGTNPFLSVSLAGVRVKSIGNGENKLCPMKWKNCSVVHTKAFVGHIKFKANPPDEGTDTLRQDSNVLSAYSR